LLGWLGFFAISPDQVVGSSEEAKTYVADKEESSANCLDDRADQPGICDSISLDALQLFSYSAPVEALLLRGGGSAMVDSVLR
jgi:hypothetical protein